MNDDQCALCKKDITEEEVKHELNHNKVPLLLSFKMAFLKKQLSTSQKQAIIKPIKKRTATKGL